MPTRSQRLRLIQALLLLLGLGMATAPTLAQPPKPGSPEQHLPPHITQLSGFGERASWSPDGQKIAFIGKSFGDAFEIDLKSRLTRLLTGHFRHPGFLRIQYLPNGDFLLIGARTFQDIRTTRDRDQEFWYMAADAKSPPVPLGQKVSEGVAISRKQMKIAWSNTHGQDPNTIPAGTSIIFTADIETHEGKPRLVNKQELLRSTSRDCVLEAQDFRDDDRELIYTCYRNPFADVLGVKLATGEVSIYRKLAGEYNEVEGIAPDGRWALVESSRDQGPDHQDSGHIDLWKLTLEPMSPGFVRITRWGDFPGYKASNPVVSPDGRRIAFQSARTDEPAGVGHGLFLLDLGGVP